MDPVTLRTNRLELTACSPKHLDSMWVGIEASLPELRLWMAWARGEKDDTKRFLERARDAWRKDDAFPFTIFLGGDAVGTVGLNRFDPLLSMGEVGYWLRSDLAGQGLMTEAVVLLVDWAFDQLKLHRLELHAATENHASIRVAEKVGFMKAGLLRDGSRSVDEWHDCFVYDLLESDDRLRPSED